MRSGKVPSAQVSIETGQLQSITVDDEDHSYLYLKDPSESSSHFVPKWLPTKKCLKDILEWVGYNEIEEVGSLDEGRSIYVARK